MKCAEADAFIHAYVDGELAGMDRDAYEQHLLACDACSHACRLQGRFKAAVRGHLPPVPVPRGLQQRISGAIASAPPIRRRQIWHAYPRLVPAAAAAVILFSALGLARRGHSPMVFEQALRTYHSALPMDVTGPSCASVVDWFRGKVDFALPTPSGDHLGPCRGGRLVNVQDRFGAYVVYQSPGGHRLDMMVFNGDDELDGADRRTVAGRDVYVGTGRGASTVAFRGRDGLTYMLTADLDQDSLQNLVQTAMFKH